MLGCRCLLAYREGIQRQRGVLHHGVEQAVADLGGVAGLLVSLLADAAAGMAAGAALLGAVALIRRVAKGRRAAD